MNARRLFATGIAGALWIVACGGTTAQQNGSSGTSGTSGSSAPRGCTEIGCQEGVSIDFEYVDPGAYVFELVVDGDKVTCKVTLPIQQAPESPCDAAGAFLGVVGSALPANQQSIEGLTLPTTTAKTISLRATRDGKVIGEKSFAVPYVTSPGPNGPGCEPKTCTLAKVTFP